MHKVGHRQCLRCGTRVRPEAKFCTRCGMRMLSSTAYEEHERPHDLFFSAPPIESGFDRVPAPASVLPPTVFGRIGPERNVVLYVVLSFFTCGFFAPVWMYLIGRDLRQALIYEDIRPGRDLLLALVTCGIWWLYLLYKYPTFINVLKDRVGLPRGELPVISLLLGILSLSLISLALMQSELNQIWRLVGGDR